METIKLPVYGIEITHINFDSGASISSDLKDGGETNPEFEAAMDAIESMVIAHFCARIDVLNPAHLKGGFCFEMLMQLSVEDPAMFSGIALAIARKNEELFPTH